MQLAGAAGAARLDGEALDVALLVEDPRELALEPRRRDVDVVVLRRAMRVAHAREEVGDGSVIDIG